MADLLPLLNLAHSLKSEKSQIPIAFVRMIELSPVDAARLKALRTADQAVKSEDGCATLYGIEFCTHAYLPDGHALVKFADGRIGHWKIGEDHMNILDPGSPPYVVK